MKRLLCVLIAILLLTGCSGNDGTMDSALHLRSDLLAAQLCSFDAQITADYGNVTYTFTLRCQADREGNLTFEVTEPESISGITGKISANGGKLTFDDVALSFELLADGQLTPVSAPWVFVSTLRGGYITSAGADGEYTRLTINDSYAEDALTVDIWLNEANLPVQAEIEWENRRILTMEIKNFTLS